MARRRQRGRPGRTLPPRVKRFSDHPERSSARTHAHRPFERGEYPRQVTLAQGQQADPPIRTEETRGVSGRLGEPEPFLPEDATLGEHPQLGMARGEVGTGVHCGHEDVTEALVAARLIKRRHDLLHAGNRPTIVALFLTGSAQGRGSPARAGPSSPLAAASARARWAAAAAWSCAPSMRKCCDKKPKISPSGENRRGPWQAIRPRADRPAYAQNR